MWNTRRGALSGDGGAWRASGSVLALIPLTTTEPSRRILGVAALGVSGALGVLIEKWAGGFRRPLRPWGLAGVIAVALIGYVHLIAAPLETRRLSRQAVEDEIRSVAEVSMVWRQNGPVNTTLVLRANYSTTVLWTPFALRRDAPNHWWVLSQTFEQTVAIRTSPGSWEQADKPPRSDVIRGSPASSGSPSRLSSSPTASLRQDAGLDPSGAPRKPSKRFLSCPAVRRARSSKLSRPSSHSRSGGRVEYLGLRSSRIADDLSAAPRIGGLHHRYTRPSTTNSGN